MRNATSWVPSKFVLREGGRLTPTRDRRALAPSSRLIADRIAREYNYLLPQFAHGTLLDLGCGRAPLFAAYRDRVDEVVCVDWPTSLHGNQFVDVYCDLGRMLPFADSSFDTVLFSDVLEHLPEPELAFKEIARLLRPGGAVILNTPFLYRIHEEPHDYYRHTRFSLHRLAERSGLAVVYLEEIGGAGDVVVDLAAKLLAPIPLLGNVLGGLLQAFAISAHGWWPWSSMTRATRQAFPLGHAVVAVLPGAVHVDKVPT